MNDRSQTDVLGIIRETMAAVSMELQIIESATGVNMMYDFIDHCILVDAERLHEARLEMEEPIELADYVRALTLHELGHALDRKALLASLPKTREIIELKREHTWDELSASMEWMKKLVDENDRDYVFEQTAWTNAARMNNMCRLVDKNCLSKMERHGLKTYEQVFLEDRIVYDGLAAAESAVAD
ncbi:hypothetical protein NCCP2716_08330 [Sporosarcina sp. NCCP-2716]|uniref:integrase n=1 Tax=Sporosarcina sp. NCCP-2716 TaxID=2943679 RepID=UPI00203F56EE|nr:integrase [Sporosarcina sp. NCCP-2716]GKV68335.1 hypothetical protein NCCP2716_08330 [Sporosarcina sp. NCCP-2716]